MMENPTVNQFQVIFPAVLLLRGAQGVIPPMLLTYKLHHKYILIVQNCSLNKKMSFFEFSLDTITKI